MAITVGVNPSGPPQSELYAGVATEGLDPTTARLLPLGIDELGKAIDDYANGGSKEEKIYALNLDYMARNFDAREAERVLALPPEERARLAPLDFLRAKAHLVSNPELRKRLVEPRLHFTSYGKGAERRDIAAGALVHIGRYTFLVKDVAAGGRKDVRLSLYYQRVPSFLSHCLQTLERRPWSLWVHVIGRDR